MNNSLYSITEEDTLANIHTRQYQYRLRMNEEELDMLEHISQETGMTKAEILRKGLKMMHNLHRYG